MIESLQKLITGSDGISYFRRLPELSTYKVQVKYGTHEEEVYMKPDGEVEIRLSVFNGGNIQAYLHFVLIFSILAVILLISAKLILYVRSALR